ncbi:hypothetical protein [Shouchella lonarensis]|uniref:Uncharacterized protein n=1 Tax=Shouchella lonarensis TaxID=1464122 RepID=A0A1G6GHU7_9BACI|nr:hypothetical protein [Shouchella lonarensis]SDB81567.1 hypothetical protein SAMN05421737_10184 [Shouchella lonarensis]
MLKSKEVVGKKIELYFPVFYSTMTTAVNRGERSYEPNENECHN